MPWKEKRKVTEREKDTKYENIKVWEILCKNRKKICIIMIFLIIEGY